MRRAAAVAMLFTATAGGVTACSSVEPRLHAGPIEQRIIADSRSEFAGSRLGVAHCPADRRQRAGDTFQCTLLIDGQLAHFRVRQTDGHGSVAAPELVERFVPVHDLEVAVADDLRARELLDVTARCGPGVIVLVGGPVLRRCTATYARGLVRHYVVSLGADTQVQRILPVDALVATFPVSTDVAARLTKARGHPVAVDCGDRRIVLAPGAVLPCVGTDGTTQFAVLVRIRDASGGYTFTPSR